MYALIDSNNFFVSCERLFRPDLAELPTIVLSSNDGCAVARSNEAKALGIKMGEPLHELKRRFIIIEGSLPCAQHRREREASGRARAVGERSDAGTQREASLSLDHGYLNTAAQPKLVVFSANFRLYGDISRRIARTLARITPRIELYSIDEAFLDLGELDIPDYASWGRALAARIFHDIGVPVSVGIAPTKTLCKLAADYAKHHPECQAAYFIDAGTSTSALRERRPRRSPRVERADSEQSDAATRGRGLPLPKTMDELALATLTLLGNTPVQNIWGVGWRLAPKLKAEGIHTALDLARLRPQRAQQLMGIHGRRMAAELCGTSCIPLQSAHKPQQIISRGRQFGHDTSDFSVIEATIASMTASATATLRREGRLATRASVRISTHRLKPGYRAISRDVRLYTPTADTGIIASQLARLMQYDFDSHLRYHKTEVTLWDLVPDTQLQTDVFGRVNSKTHKRSTALMYTLDSLNAKHGSGALRYAAEDLSHAWHPRKTLASPPYTTNWHSLPEVHTSDILSA